MLATVLALAGIGTFVGLIAMFGEKQKSSLESYINSRNPMSNIDVDTYTREFEIKHSRLP
jgi:hypothetical protein